MEGDAEGLDIQITQIHRIRHRKRNRSIICMQISRFVIGIIRRKKKKNNDWKRNSGYQGSFFTGKLDNYIEKLW